MPGNIGWQGLVVILIILLLVFGPKRLPEMGRSIGRGMREFKDSLSGKDDDEPEKTELTPPPPSQSTTTASNPAQPTASNPAQPESERVSH